MSEQLEFSRLWSIYIIILIILFCSMFIFDIKNERDSCTDAYYQGLSDSFRGFIPDSKIPKKLQSCYNDGYRNGKGGISLQELANYTIKDHKK